MNKLSYITEEGLKKLIAEVELLKTKERPKISKEIAEARDKGDLSENAEYDAAKEKQGLLELKISKLGDVLSRARVVDLSSMPKDQIHILSKFKVKNLNNSGMKRDLKIVSSIFLVMQSSCLCLKIA